MKVKLVSTHNMLLSLAFCFVILFSGGQCVSVNIVGDGQISVQQGNSILLQCNYAATGGSMDSSQTNVEWVFRKDPASTAGDNIVSNGQVMLNFQDQFSFQAPASLRLNNADYKTNAGVYDCIVTNPTNSPSKDQKSITVTVTVPPSIPHCGFTSDLALTLGFRQTFTCNSMEGIPAPTYRWNKDGAFLPSTYTMSPVYANTSFSVDSNTGDITFAKVSKGDAGVYFCEARNTLGAQSCTAVKITIKEQDVGLIVGIVFMVIFIILLLLVLAWWTRKKGYCSDFYDKEEDFTLDDDGSNDVMLDGHGPIVTKAPSDISSINGKKQEASMMI